jgi:hypothetical protein
MSESEPFDPLLRFAELERLVSKIYFRFSHVFLVQLELREFWWEMAREEEQHACILHACRALIENYEEERLDPNISRDKAQRLSLWLQLFSRSRHGFIDGGRSLPHRSGYRRLRDRRDL